MAKFLPIAMVIDRPTAARAAEGMRALPSQWGEMFQLWEQVKSPYLVMLAHTRERVRVGAPLTAMCLTDEALRDTIRMYCAQLNDVACKWHLFVEKGSTAETVAQAEILADSVPEGRS